MNPVLTKRDLLEPLARLRTDEVVITSMGVVRPWGRLSDSDLDFASADSAMGHTADLALGVALARPERRCRVFEGALKLPPHLRATPTTRPPDGLNRRVTRDVAGPIGPPRERARSATGVG